MQSLPPSILSTLPPSWCGVHSHMWVWLSCMSSLKANQSPRMSTAVFKTVVWLTVLQRLVLRCCSRTALHATPHTPSRNGLLQVRWSAFLTGQPKSRHITHREPLDHREGQAEKRRHFLTPKIRERTSSSLEQHLTRNSDEARGFSPQLFDGSEKTKRIPHL